MYPGQRVFTPYGESVIANIRDDCTVVVSPLNWTLAQGQKPTFYMNPSDIKPVIGVGDIIKCSFGIGSVVHIRSDGIHVVTLSNWSLATGKSPTLYLNCESFTKNDCNLSEIDTAKVENTNEALFEKEFMKVLEAREAGKVLYMKQNYSSAKEKFEFALYILQNMNMELTRPQRAKLFETSLTCNSNASLCSWYLEEFGNCIVFGKNSLTLIDVLERNMQENEFWQELMNGGMTVEKVSEMKLKALRIVGKAELKKKDFDNAKEHLEAAVKLSTKISNAKLTKELSGLLSEAQKNVARFKKKEKAMWSKAFEKGGKEPDEPKSNVEVAATPEKINQGTSKASKPGNGKNDSSGKSSKYNQVWSPDKFFGSFYGSFAVLSVLGIGAAYLFWTRRKR